MITSTNLKAALARWCDALEAAAPELNALDAQLGDGDLGATLHKCAQNVREALPGMPDELAGVFERCASACAKASGSSFGTLLALGFLAVSRELAGARALSKADVVRLLDGVVASLAARGGASLGDKTMLDSLDAIGRALELAPEADAPRAAIDAAEEALARFRDKPNRIGRARMFADKSVGMDDPGMVAVLRMAQALQATQTRIEG
ncbi:MAG TPA: DAK2 domain-containing protein [Ramlibacter sp.]|uniref:DAK2 domain-containing protein n=1 Tax=Ramlibacter sp. TaxID=1917967 RepID=UPI002C074B97|nr:DAK2 domain-containing protein [Ramlibacter sp.]HVZ43542.1 DAK2 domain-containing protein [Ramlibacter sp.]